MADRIKAVVLAAGRSTRMKSDISKVLHPILGKEIIRYLLDSLLECGLEPEDIVVVVGDNRAEIEKAIGGRLLFARQREQLGTAHALLSAAAQVAAHAGGLLVLVGDNPYITAARAAQADRPPSAQRRRLHVHQRRFPRRNPPLRPHRPRRAGESPAHRGRKGRQPRGTADSRGECLDLPVRQSAGFPAPFQDRQRQRQKGILPDRHHRAAAPQGPRGRALPADDRDIALGINDRRDLQEAQRKFNSAPSSG